MIEFIKDEKIQLMVLKISDSIGDAPAEESINPLFRLAHLAKMNMDGDQAVAS
jgi:hypothetical protein